MKYSITHCYTDKNKGDAAIIIATAQLIKQIDKNSKINMFSTYGINDERFQNEHNIIKKYANNLFPACFGDPVPIRGFGDKSRLLAFLLNFFKTSILLVTRNKQLLKLLFTDKERLAINEYLDSDVIISKGGSYITTQNKTIRQTLSLIRILYPFMLAKRYNKKIYIFSQSLGPIEGLFNRLLFNFSLKHVKKIFLRESLCYEKYDYVKTICDIVGYRVIPDTAFYLKADSNSDIYIDSNEYNIGYTLVDHAFKYIKEKEEKEEKINNYKNSIIKSIRYLIDHYNAIIHIFPQVLVDNSVEGNNDLRISKEIKMFFKDTKYDEKVNMYTENLSPAELKYLYSQMQIFIGTRLHSVIFSLSIYVPSINISYHGTKSKGILYSLEEFNNFVLNIDTLTSDVLIQKINELISRHGEMINILSKTVPSFKIQLETAMENIING